MWHHQQTYLDLGFLIPANQQVGDPLPTKFMVFFNSKGEAEEAAKFLRSHLPVEMCDKVQWLHAGMTPAFCNDEIRHLVNGEWWGLALTDVRGMVSSFNSQCNVNLPFVEGVEVPDITLIVQWKAPKDLCTLMQQFG